MPAPLLAMRRISFAESSSGAACYHAVSDFRPGGSALALYEYLCSSCKNRFEKRMPMADVLQLVPCPKCKKQAQKVLGGFAVVGRSSSSDFDSFGDDGGGGDDDDFGGGGSDDFGGHGHSHGPGGHSH